jgi:signal transduction histidine kinase
MIKVMKSGRDNLTEMMAEALSNAKRVNSPRKIGTYSLQELLTEISEAEVKSHPDLRNRLIEFTLNGDVPKLNFCRLEIRRVLVNLIVNAAQACGYADLIEVGLDANDGEAVVYVMDRGVGIAEEIKERIYDSNYSTKEGGNGLGLTSCRHIIEGLHGGKLRAVAREGGGTIFTFTLALNS